MIVRLTETDHREETGVHDGQADAASAATRSDDSHGESAALMKILTDDGKGGLSTECNRQSKK